MTRVRGTDYDQDAIEELVGNDREIERLILGISLRDKGRETWIKGLTKEVYMQLLGAGHACQRQVGKESHKYGNDDEENGGGGVGGLTYERFNFYMKEIMIRILKAVI